MDKDLLDMTICRIPGLKAEERVNLIKKFDREEDFQALSKKDIENIIERVLRGSTWTIPQIRALAEKDAKAALKQGIQWVSWREKAYPPLLREIFDPPALLFYRGALPSPEKPLAAIVGTRKPTSQARARAYSLGKALGEAGIPVVSGLALGIDSMAHRGNVEASSPTVAVLGSGPDMIYPVSNRDLARRILNTGGAIFSEYPPGTGPAKWHFPARNRIISGLARGTVVVEAPEKSGALITARYALEQNRDLWVDIAGVNSKNGAGMAKFAEDGAKQLYSARDILAEWGISQAPHGCPNDRAGLASSLAEYLDIKL